MKKKITALCLCVALLAVAVVGASLAYFTDTKSATNTFTVGNVKIDLIESRFHREGNDNSGDTSIPDPTHKVVTEDGMEYVKTGHTMFTNDEIKADAETYKEEYLNVKGQNMVPGRGVSAQIENTHVLAGTPGLLREHGVSIVPPEEAAAFARQGCTIIYVSIDGAFAGFIALSDTLREESSTPISQLPAGKSGYFQTDLTQT